MVNSTTTPPTQHEKAIREALPVEHRSLYEISGCIADFNTLLIGRTELAEMRAEVERLRAELDARDGLLREVEKYMCEQPAVWGVLGLLKRIRAALDASRLALKEETK